MNAGLVALLVCGLLRAEEAQCPPDKALLANAEAMTKQLNDLRAAVADREQKIILLKLEMAQKEVQLQFYAACATVGLLADGSCEVNLQNKMVNKKEPPRAETK